MKKFDVVRNELTDVDIHPKGYFIRKDTGEPCITVKAALRFKNKSKDWILSHYNVSEDFYMDVMRRLPRNLEPVISSDQSYKNNAVVAKSGVVESLDGDLNLGEDEMKRLQAIRKKNGWLV